MEVIAQILLWILVIVFVAYFLPTLIALIRNAENKWAIAFINLILGWTFIVWVGSFIWAIVSPSQNKNELKQFTNAQNQLSLACGSCSEIINIGDKFCSKCGEKLKVTIVDKNTDKNENVEQKKDEEIYNFKAFINKISLYRTIAIITFLASVAVWLLNAELWFNFTTDGWIANRVICYNCETSYYLGENSDFVVRFVTYLIFWIRDISRFIGLMSLIFVFLSILPLIKEDFKKIFITTLQNKISNYIFLSIPISIITHFLISVILWPIAKTFTNYNGVRDAPIEYIGFYSSWFIWIPSGIAILFPIIFLYRMANNIEVE